MNKLALLAVFAVFFAALGSSQVYYSVDADRDSVVLNATVNLQCNDDCPVNSWSLDWRKPEGAELIGISDSLGEIDEYTVEERSVSIQTNSGQARENETVKMGFRIDREAEEVYNGLYKRELSLAGFGGRETSGVVNVDDLLSGKTSFGFETGFEGEEMRFQGRGPVYLRFKFGDGYETRYFSFFGDYRENASKAYEVPVGTMGIYQDFERFPVAVMPDEVYDEKVNNWSSGEYVSGSMTMRESLGDDFLPVLAHEVVHGLNDRVLKWDATRSSYIDEGVAEHIESLVRKGEGLRTRNLFGGEKVYREKVNGTTYQYTLESKGDRDALWNYYNNDREFMKSWNAMESIQANRKFGYAYSELIIKNYIANMNGSLRDFYSQLDVGKEVAGAEEKWEIYSEIFDMTPCRYESYERFQDCLESVNNHDYPAYLGTPQRGDSVLDVRELKVPDRTGLGEEPGLDSIEWSWNDFVSYLVDYFAGIVQGLKASF